MSEFLLTILAIAAIALLCWAGEWALVKWLMFGRDKPKLPGQKAKQSQAELFAKIEKELMK